MKIAVKGIGMTKFGELWDKSLFDLALEAIDQTIKDSSLSIQDIDAIYVANMTYAKTAGQNHLGAYIATQLGTNVPAFFTESACASGGMATHLAIQSLESGQYKNVLVVGAEKMTDVSPSEITTALMGAGADEEKQAGLTFPGLYALIAKAHIQKYGTTREQLAQVSIKNHYHGTLNPKAHFQSEVTLEKVLNSSLIASPLTLLDSSPISDGAAALILSSDIKKNDVYISGSAVATDTISLAQRDNLTEIKATKIASEKALKQADIKITDVNLAEVHDCFSIAEILAMEDLGFCKKGEGGKFIESGQTKLGGKMVVNTSGGLKACGHPVGATGIKQLVELTLQLRGQADKRQVKDAKIGLAQNVGGTGATVVVHILQI